MVTVGYGDFSPSNVVEAGIVMVIQVVGTAIFGYMINIVGITVKEIQNRQTEFDQKQSTIGKLKDHYKLSNELCYRLKKDLRKKQSELKATPLESNEEQEFLDTGFH